MGAHDTIKMIQKLAFGSAGKREYFRIPSHAKARIRSNGDVIEGEVENISMNGAYVRLSKQVKINSSIIISILDNATTSRTTFDLKAKVVWVMGDAAGLQFV